MSSPLFVISYVALWIVVIVETLLLLGLLLIVSRDARAPEAPRQRLGGLEPGTVAPSFAAVDVQGRPISSSDIADALTALLFVSPRCQSCLTTLEELAGVTHKVSGNVVVVCQGAADECVGVARAYRLPRTIVDEDGSLSRTFRVDGVPIAVLVDRMNRVRSYGRPQRGDDLAKDLQSIRLAVGLEAEAATPT